jgi:toxin-antitoxin system PIN domain toxin
VKIVDVNILVYVTNTRDHAHSRVKAWWDVALQGDEPLGLTWHALVGFVRLATTPKVFSQPLPVGAALSKTAAWLSHPNTRLIQETAVHAEPFAELLAALGTAGKLTSDAHLAALAISHNATLVSCDTDFGRFRRLKWENPLAVP